MIRRSFNIDGLSQAEALDAVTKKYTALGMQFKKVKAHVDSCYQRVTVDVEASGEFEETWAAEVDKVFQNSR